ncbi:MAG TPA: PKD domain-containing protein [Conexibacter sp.]|jgi:PKD repeat protein
MPRSSLRRFLPSRRAVAVLASTAVLTGLPASAQAEGWIDGPSFSFPLLDDGADLVGAPDGSATAVSCGSSDFSAMPTLRVQHAAPDGSVSDPLALGLCDGDSAPAAATAPSGVTAVAWWSVGEDGGGNDVSAAHVALIAADGSELWEQTLATGDAVADPRLNVSVDSAGDATVVWRDPADSAASAHVLTRRVSADGSVGAVSDLGPAGLNAPQLATAPDGTTWIASIDTATAPAAVKLARFDVGGSLQIAELPITADSRISDLKLAQSAAGGLLTWSAAGSDGAHISGLRLPSAGDLTGAPVQSAEEPIDLSGQYATVLASDGTASIAWLRIDPAQFTTTIMLSRFAGGAETAPAQAISGETGGLGANQPALAVASDGSVLATWLEIGASPIAVVGGRRIAPDGTLGPISKGPVAAQSKDGPLTLLPSRDSVGGALLGVRMAATAGNVWLATYSLDTAAPEASALIPTHAIAGTTVTMSATASDRSGTSLWWDFGDESGSRGATAQHAFANPGTYAVKLTVTDGADNSTVIASQVTVSAPQPPRAIGDTIAITPKAAAVLKLRSVARHGTRLTVGGTIASAASGKVTIAYAQKIDRTTVTKKTTTKIAKGRWRATLKLAGRLARARRGKATVTVSYAGDADTQKASAKRAIAVAKPAEQQASAKHKPAKRKKRGA